MKPGNLNWRIYGALVIILAGCECKATLLLQSVTTRSAQSLPQQNGNGDSTCPIVTPDGRFVVFASAAGNLATNNGGFVPAKMDVYVRDRVSQQTKLVSVNVNGNGGGDGDSIPTDISIDGRYVVFESSASNLVPGDTNSCSDVFVRDLVTGATALASVASDGGFGNGPSTTPVMTPDGRYVSFVSRASNLVSGDSNGIGDIFVRDLQLGVTTLASPGAVAAGSLQGSVSPVITPDGRYVAFLSWAQNVVPGLTNQGEIYLRDTVNAQTYLASTNARTIASQVFGAGDVASCGHAISDNGQYVVYEITPKPTTATSPPRAIVVRGQPFTGVADIISTNGVPVFDYENARNLDVTPDGRFVTFIADTNGTHGVSGAVYLWDALSNSTTLVSADVNGAFSPGVCDWPLIDPTGRYIAFLSTATNLVSNAPSGWGLYRRDVVAGTTALVEPGGTMVTPITCASMSSNAQLIAYESAGLLGNAAQSDVFVGDVLSGTSELISVRDLSLPSATPSGASAIGSGCISSNGRYFTFSSRAEDLATNDSNGFRDVFVQDRVAGLTVLVSANTNGVSGNGPSLEPSISGDGRYVAFTSFANDIVAGDANNTSDVFVRDMATGNITLVSVANGGVQAANPSSSPTISADGTKVLFRNGNSLFLRDLQASTTQNLINNTSFLPASMSPSGRYVAFRNSPSGGDISVYDTLSNSVVRTFPMVAPDVAATSISCTDTKLAFGTTNLTVADIATGTTQKFPARLSSRPGLRFSADARYLVYATTNNIYVFDVQLSTNILISQAFDGSAANGTSDSPDISADGRFITFLSSASNLVSDDSNGVPDVFLYDRVLGTMSIASSSRFGAQTANGRSMTPYFSPDGQTLMFESWGSDVIAQDFNQAGDLFAADMASVAPVYPGDPVMSFVTAPFTFFGMTDGGLTLAWQVDPTRTYQVQFKNDLNEPAWHDFDGNIVPIGNMEYAQDVAAESQRFYRVVLSY